MNKCVSVVVSILLSLLLGSSSSVNGLPLRQVHKREVDPVDYLSNETRVFRDGLEILEHIALHSTIIPTEEAKLFLISEVYQTVCPALDIILEYETLYINDTDHSSSTNTESVTAAVAEEIRNRTCNWINQYSGTTNLISSSCSTAELQLLCLQLRVSNATYEAKDILNVTQSSYFTWLNTHFNRSVAECLLTNRNKTLQDDTPIADCLQ